MTPQQLAVRKRLLEDFSFYAANALKVRTKAGEIKPLVLNAAQKVFLEAVEKQRKETGRVRAVILKGRQQGLSTAVGARLIWRTTQHKARKALVVAHKSDSTRALFDMTRRYYENLPEVLKPHTRYSSRSELQFDLLESSYIVATAGGDGIARGETLQYVHLSEVAFWAKSTAADNFNGLMKAVPNAPDTEVYVESTASGTTGTFADLWRGAVEGTNGFIPIFVAWYLTPEYRIAAPAGFERTPDEQKMALAYGLDDDQLYWRRREIATNGAEMFRQEYPSYPEEAFLTTGRPVFDQEQLAELLRACPGPARRMSIVPGGSEFEDDPRGELRVYEEPDVTGTYYIGADVAMGLDKRDLSCAQVLDADKRQVAVWHGKCHPDWFAHVLDALGRMYSDARIAVESNNQGLLTCVRLAKDLNYPNFYTEVTIDKTTDRETVKLGFSTNLKTKPLIINELRADMRKREIEVVDRTTLEEMRSYVATDEGKLEAEKGCHDDTVMALAIAAHIHEGAYVPVVNRPEWYVEAI